jgi:acyl-CoA dehydrogenase
VTSPKYARVTWLAKFIPRRIRELVPEAADLDVEVYVLPNLGGVNVVIHGLLGEGVAASTRFDPQAKGLGEWAAVPARAHPRRRAVMTERSRPAGALRETREFVRREVAPHLQEWEDAGEIPRELHLAAAKQGLLGVGFPEEVGGEGGDLLDVGRDAGGDVRGRRVQRPDGGLFTHGIALPHIVAAGTRTWSTGSSDRRWPARRSARSRSPSPAAAPTSPGIRHPAVRDGDHYVVNGAKTFITSGVRADFVTTAVRTRRPGHTAGSACSSSRRARRASPSTGRCQDGLALLRHRRAVVRRRAGAGRATWSARRTRGFYQIAEQFVVERIGLACTATASRPLARPHGGVLPERETFGKPLIANQVVRHKLVEMHRQVDVARTYHVRASPSGTSPARRCRSPRRAWPSRPPSRRRRGSATRRCSCTAAPATCTGPRSSGTTATRGSCPSEAPPRCSPTCRRLLGYGCHDQDGIETTEGQARRPRRAARRRWRREVRRAAPQARQAAARERIELLVDEGLGVPRAVAAGRLGHRLHRRRQLVTGIGVVEGVECMIIANDPTVRAAPATRGR